MDEKGFVHHCQYLSPLGRLLARSRISLKLPAINTRRVWLNGFLYFRLATKAGVHIHGSILGFCFSRCYSADNETLNVGPSRRLETNPQATKVH